MVSIKNIKRRYISGLAIIALTLVLSQIIVHFFLVDNGIGHVINIAGRQRMLSQKIAKTALLIAKDRSKMIYVIELKHALALFQSSHHALADPAHHRKLGHKNSAKVQSLFTQLEPYYREMLVSSYEILSSRKEWLPDDILITKILEAETRFQPLMDRIVSTYDEESTQHINLLSNLEWGLFGMAMLTLILEVIFIFDPMVKTVQEEQKILISKKEGELAEQNMALEMISEELKQQNEELLQTHDALLDHQSEIHQKNDILTKTNAELDHFVYRVSHDLRAPLASSLGLINLLYMNTPREQDQELYEMLQDSLELMDSFIADILDYSRNNRMEIIHQPFCLQDLIDEIIEWQYDHHAATAKMAIRLSIPLDMIIHSDRPRLKIILTNLISNSIKFRNPEVEKPYVAVTAKQEHGKSFISVEDNGIGIPPEYHRQIFDMFFRANMSYRGPGIGLYIAKEAAEKLKGSLTVASVVGKGSTFTIAIPDREMIHDHEAI